MGVATLPRESPLDRARRKAYWRLLPLCFLCYVIAYVDRANVAIAKLTMTKDLPGFDNAVIGFGAGMFFIGYFMLEIPGSLLVERWSARKWISRIMVSWGIMAALTALVVTPWQFYTVRFLLGLAQAGFYPGIIVYLTHWFPMRDRARALAYFFVATPVAQIISPKLSSMLLVIGTEGRPEVLGLEGWQWVYIAWGIPAVVLGIIVLFTLTDRPSQASWLDPEEREALQAQLDAEHHGSAGRKMTVLDGLRHPKVLLLALAYFFVVTGNYGIEFFLPSILQRWYGLELSTLAWLVMLPPTLALVGQLAVGWSSDRTKERRWHVVAPISIGGLALILVTATQGSLWLTILLFMIAAAGFKAYLPAFWSLPNIFLSRAAAAGSIGFINSVGNLGGFLGPYVIGTVETMTGSFTSGIIFLGFSALASATTVFLLGLGARSPDGAVPVVTVPESAAGTIESPAR